MIGNPNETQRVLIIGRTGSGKSQFGMHLLSSRDFDVRPWVIIDCKGGDDIIRALVRQNKSVTEISPTDKPPTKPGLYYMRTTPILDDIAVQAWLMAVWENGRAGQGTGLFIDEGYQIPKGPGLDIILTQGRALGIPVIILYQRAAWLNRFAIAGADYIVVFALINNADRDNATNLVDAIQYGKKEITPFTRIPKYWSLYYDVGEGKTTLLTPAPVREEILGAFKSRLTVERKKGLVV